MDYLSINQLTGDQITMKRTDPRHLSAGGVLPQGEEKGGTGFTGFFTDALNSVNDTQQSATALMQKMVTDPDSVDAHDISIAIAKANTSLSITKSIVDNALKAYREIMSIR